MWALVVGAIYFGSFIAIGWTAKVVVRYVMNQYGADLADVQGPGWRAPSIAVRFSCWERGGRKSEGRATAQHWEVTLRASQPNVARYFLAYLRFFAASLLAQSLH